MAYQRPKIEQDVVRSCRQLSSWKSLLLAIIIYVLVIAMIALYREVGLWWLGIPIILIIGGLQNHLLILLHEGAHHLLHSNRLLNDIIADYFCAFPFFTFQINYRIVHLNHHKYSGSPARDPEVANYEFQNFMYARKKGFALWKMIFLDLSGVNLFRTQLQGLLYVMKMKREGKARRIFWWEWLGFFGFWGAIAALTVHFNLLFELYVFWIVPQIFVTFPLLKLHGYGEHTGATGPTEYQRTWVHNFSPIANFFVYPIKSGYHLEHHMFPMIPWFNMMRFRAALLGHEEFARESAAVTVDGLFFGKRTIWGTMISGEGDYRTVELHARTDELQDEIISLDADKELDEQYAP